MIKRVLLYLNRGKPAVVSAVHECIKLCHQHEIKPYLIQEDKQWLEQLEQFRSEPVPYCGCITALSPGDVDLILAFGGDGTMLRALDSYVDDHVPMLGINLGRMGFLLETDPPDMNEAIIRLKMGKYRIERRMMLYIEGVCDGKQIKAYATNEVSISRGLSQRMIALDAHVGDMLVDHYIADGLVVSSPTGSTAYSLSAGGPIVAPDVQCFLLNPICPHTLTARPIVLSAQECIRLTVRMKESREGIQLSLDGQAVCQMHNLEEIRIIRSPHDALLVRFEEERNYFSLLKDKLSQWSL